MGLGFFPRVIYKGSIAGGTFSIVSGNEKYIFSVGDILIAAIKKNFDEDEYIVEKRIVIDEQCTDVPIKFTAEDTSDLPQNDEDGVFEVKLISQDGQINEPVYQEKIRMGGVVINEW